ncbi:transcriptional regulator [Skermanella stibiiresistens SB22]|uniref:Transcriptional regulator n=1 Tax=Skermanella stibiiresistens SB22 TaxID=1385369 RepID=W9HBY5_9PROT|nr:response regulator transcription factor [Skermanella stibiiresistens]EWY41403.1 transcriptional regulator [Skermanella stibiiresistens SB22]
MRILIGDDHALFREGINRLLEQIFSDAEYIQAATFQEVVAQCSGTEPPDLILTDLQMPGWPGFDGIRQIKALLPKTALVVVSASENGADARQAIDQGAGGFIPKSSSVQIMVSALRLVLAGGVYVPHAMMNSSGSGLTSVPRDHSGSSDQSSHISLTQRQRDVLGCLREGKSNKQIAYELGLSEGTVKIHVTAIFKSLGVKNRTQAVISASRHAMR